MPIAKILTVLALCLFSLSCNTSQNSKHIKTTDKLTYMEGYFANNTLEFSSNTKQVVITSKPVFDTYFGVAKTMDNTISELDFTNNNYAAIITKPAFKKQTISIVKSEEKNGQLTLTYKLMEEGEQSFASNDLKIFPISKTVKSVNFIVDGKSELVEVR